MQGRVVHLRDDLRGEEHAHRDLEAGAAAKPTKYSVRPALLRQWDAFRREKASQVAGMALLFADECFDGGDVGVVADAGGVCTSGRIEMAPLGALPQLELLHGRGDGASLVVGEANGAAPGHVRRDGVGGVVGAPFERRSWRACGVGARERHGRSEGAGRVSCAL